MKIQFLAVGKAHEPYVKTGVEDFTSRISKYYPVEWKIVPLPKNSGAMDDLQLKKKEGELLLETIQREDYVIILEERGKQLSSEGLAAFIQSRANVSVKKIIFLIGGAYGIDDAVQNRAQTKWSLSSLVFPHQLVRLILAEQVYRACTILRNEKYHHA